MTTSEKLLHLRNRVFRMYDCHSLDQRLRQTFDLPAREVDADDIYLFELFV